MNAVRLRALAIALCMLAATVLGHAMRPTRHLSDMVPKINLEAIFPRSFGDWQLDTRLPVAIVAPDVQAKLNELYNQVLTRTYVNARGDRIMVSVAYGGDQSDATRAHRPDVCYPAQGFEILSQKWVSLRMPDRILPVEQMLAKLGGRIEPVTFWFAVGDHVAVSGQDQKIQQLRYGLQGIIPDGMLVRVSSLDSEADRAYALQADFIRQMQLAFDPAWIPRVFGRADAGASLK